MALTGIAVRTARAASVDRKLADERGLYLLVTVSGSKLWRVKYRIDGKEKKLALGSYPEVGLKEARNRRDSAWRAAETGSDPAAAKREARIARQFSASNTFGAIAEEYIAKLEAEKKAEVTIAMLRWLLSKLSPSLERLSWPLFFDPAFDAVVEPLPGFTPCEAGQRWDGASVHAPIGTYGDYLLGKVGKVGKVFPELAAQAVRHHDEEFLSGDNTA